MPGGLSREEFTGFDVYLVPEALELNKVHALGLE
jgi:hypothetical protein